MESARKICFGRLVARQRDAARAFDGFEVDFASGLCTQPRAQPSPLERERFAPPSRRVDLRRLRAPSDQFLEQVVLRRENFRGARQRRNGIVSHGARERGQRIVAQAVARVRARVVRFILAKNEMPLLSVGVYFFPREKKQRADDSDLRSLQACLFAQTGKTPRSPAAREMEEHGLGGITGVMPEKNRFCAVLPRGARVKSPSQFSGRFFDRFLVPRGARAGLSATAGEDRARIRGQLAHELRVAVRRLAAQPVMEMRDDKFPEAGPLQQVEQCDRIDPAGNAGNDRRGPRHASHACEEARQEVGRLVHACQAGANLAAPKYGWRISGKCTEPSGC